MNDPQIWTLIGVFTAVMLGGMTLMTTQLTRVLRAEISGVVTKIDAVDIKLSSRIDAVDTKLSSRIDAVEAILTTKLESLDRDVASLTRGVWGDSPAD